MPIFPFSQMKPKHFSQLICPIYFRNLIRLYCGTSLIYRQRMIHIPAGISDYCWSLPPDHGVLSEDASHILFLSSLCIAADLYPIDIVHQYLLHHRRSKQKDFLPPALPVVTLSLRLPMPSKPAPAAGMGKAGRHHVRHTAGNRRDAFFQFTPRVHWRNWSYRTISHNRLPAEVQASQLPQLIISFRNSIRIQVSISALTAIIDRFCFIDRFLAKSP